MSGYRRLRIGLAATATALALTGMVSPAVAADEGSSATGEDSSSLNVEDLAGVDVRITDPLAGGISASNFHSEINGWLPGKTSRKWTDEDYTEIKFTGCDATTGSRPNMGTSTHVKLWQYDVGPDDDLGEKKFTNCFTGSNKTSKGEWNRSSSSHSRWFEISKINGYNYDRYLKLEVDKVYVDTSKAD